MILILSNHFIACYWLTEIFYGKDGLLKRGLGFESHGYIVRKCCRRSSSTLETPTVTCGPIGLARNPSRQLESEWFFIMNHLILSYRDIMCHLHDIKTDMMMERVNLSCFVRLIFSSNLHPCSTGNGDERSGGQVWDCVARNAGGWDALLHKRKRG